jgi:tRNA dimethylallyltransferase
MPIICGGTHYYVQHFLFPPSSLSIDRAQESNAAGHSKVSNTKWTPPCDISLLEGYGMLPDSLDASSRRVLETFFLPENLPLDQTPSGDKPPPSAQSTHEPIDKEKGSLALYHLLEILDAAEAARWHWRDSRKVRRSLERWWENRADDVHQRQCNLSSTSEMSEDKLNDGMARLVLPMLHSRPFP